MVKSLIIITVGAAYLTNYFFCHVNTWIAAAENLPMVKSLIIITVGAAYLTNYYRLLQLSIIIF